jgi:hypothetical protein
VVPLLQVNLTATVPLAELFEALLATLLLELLTALLATLLATLLFELLAALLEVDEPTTAPTWKATASCVATEKVALPAASTVIVAPLQVPFVAL